MLDPPRHAGGRGDREPDGHRGASRRPRRRSRSATSTVRKNLLEYDEVMDEQRKRVYGFRQEILDGANCKVRILEMIDEQIDAGGRRASSPTTTAPASFAEFAAQSARRRVRRRRDFARQRLRRGRPAPPRTRRPEHVQTSGAGDARREPRRRGRPKEWNWQALSRRRSTRAGT